MRPPRPGPLPRPRRERWQPLRGGLLNLYRYDHEEFRYEDGHLLLRGNNGTGKSRVLALQLPFLLDGEVSPYRMEPDRDSAKRAEWNLLMGKYPDRLGYTWIEFGRRDGEGDGDGKGESDEGHGGDDEGHGGDDEGHGGEEHYLTLGCGLHAVQGRGLVHKWFFITEERIGEGLFLHTSAGQALSRVRLAETLGERGEVFTTAAEYRAAVDRRLFRLGLERYSALIDLLIQLRQPQLSRKLDEKRLSVALSEALPPLSPSLLDDVAEAFRSLEDDRLSVERLEAAEGGVEEFLAGYRRYARIAACRRGERVRKTHAAYEATQRRLRAAETKLEEIGAELEARQREIEELRLGREAAGARVRALETSPEMRDKKALDEARRRAEERRAEERRAARDLETAGQRSATRAEELGQAEQGAAAAWREAEKSLGEARQAARTVGLDPHFEAAVETLDLPERGPTERQLPEDAASAALDAARQRLAEEAQKRGRQGRHLAELESALEAAENALSRAKEKHSEHAAELDDALEEQRQAHAGLDEASRELAAAYRAWHGSASVLRAAEPAAVVEELESWIHAESGRDPVAEAVRRATSAAFERLAAERANLEEKRAAASAALAELEVEAERLRRGVHAPPPLAHTRSAPGREARSGAPLFLLCDFVPATPADARAGIEAALEAAGLLDAWLTPDGRLLDPADADAVLLPREAPRPQAEATLASVLAPAAERPDPRAAAVDEAVIRGVLERIGYAAPEAGHEPGGETWISADGRFRLGPLHGSWSKPRAQHLGASAREAERQRRLAELREALAEARDHLQGLDAGLERNAGRQRQARREADAAPSSDDVHRSRARIDQATASVRQRRERLTAAEERVAEHRHDAAAARDERDVTAHDFGLADWIGRPRVLENALGDYQQRLAVLWPTLKSHLAARRRAREAAAHHREATADEERAASRRHDAEARARQAEAERDALAETLGTAVDEVMRRLAAARDELQRLTTAKERADEHRHQLEIERAVTDKEIESATANLHREAVEREAAAKSLARYAATRLLYVALPGLEAGAPGVWSITRTVEVARQIDAALSTLDSGDEAWERHQRDVARRFQTLLDHLLAHGYQPFSEIEDELFVVLVPYQGRDRTLTELLAHLREDLLERRSILNAREREVLENHLVGEVALHLHERLRAAEEWVERINRLLGSRPTSSGMKLRFAWPPADDGPPNLAEARRRLLATGATWSPEDREALGDFLQAQIQAERAKGEGTWREQLAAALDYRTWHQFAVERHQDGQWKRLTRRTYGTGSGGEKAIALTLPQFAAAAAHYESADAKAPRLILLDEAFVGVDAAMRAKCMGLLVAFDLDFVMTSEREWGCYATLPGLAVYQLSTRPGIDAVGITRWVWNGRERRLDPHPPPAEPPAA